VKRSTLQVPGGNPEGIAINAVTGTLYVPTLTAHGPSLISVFNAATCNGTDHTGCHHTPAKIAVGNYPNAIATDPTAGTAYVANLDNSVSVIPLTHPMP
jgi:DNA-binding beta-propeller fold protein YncE